MEDKPRTAKLPEEWAAELERAGGGFDARLDRFLATFHGEIVAARALKEQLDADQAPQGAKQEFKNRMHRIRALLEGEGKHFVEGLERRDPTLTARVCGQNTLELAHGIERLETAVREEEASRRKQIAALPPIDTPREKSFEAGHPLPVGADGRALPPGVASASAFPNLNSDETLQLMQSDIHALKLELMRLQRAKNAGIPLASSVSAGDSNNSASGGSTFSMSSVSPEGKAAAQQAQGATVANNNAIANHTTSSSVLSNSTTGATAATTLASSTHNGATKTAPSAPTSHGATKTSALAPSYVSHLEQMKSRLDALEKKPLSRTARRKSHARLGRTRTMNSLYDSPALCTLDENANPNVSAMTTPPRMARKPGDVMSPNKEGETFVTAAGSLESTPSPKQGVGAANQHDGTNGNGANGKPSVGAGSRLFIDGPEELLKRPQSHAATRDMQRYSLKVARRFGMNEGVATTAHVVEPRSKSAITTSPRKHACELGVQAHDHVGTMSSLASGTTSTIDTTGSGGRVVEEMEGDMWVRKGVLWKRWRRRYASMVSHQFFGRVLCLFSYDASGGVNSARSQIIVLRDGLCRGMRNTVDVAGVERYAFVLRTAAKEYYFAAESDELRRNWVRELRDAAKRDTVRGTMHSSYGSNTSRLPTQQRSIFS